MSASMAVSFRPAENLHTAECLIRQNMAAYYVKLRIRWDSTLFEANWGEFKNYEICVDGQAVGFLCLSYDDIALHGQPRRRLLKTLD